MLPGKAAVPLEWRERKDEDDDESGASDSSSNDDSEAKEEEEEEEEAEKPKRTKRSRKAPEPVILGADNVADDAGAVDVFPLPAASKNNLGPTALSAIFPHSSEGAALDIKDKLVLGDADLKEGTPKKVIVRWRKYKDSTGKWRVCIVVCLRVNGKYIGFVSGVFNPGKMNGGTGQRSFTPVEMDFGEPVAYFKGLVSALSGIARSDLTEYAEPEREEGLSEADHKELAERARAVNARIVEVYDEVMAEIKAARKRRPGKPKGNRNGKRPRGIVSKADGGRHKRVKGAEEEVEEEEDDDEEEEEEEDEEDDEAVAAAVQAGGADTVADTAKRHLRAVSDMLAVFKSSSSGVLPDQVAAALGHVVQVCCKKMPAIHKNLASLVSSWVIAWYVGLGDAKKAARVTRVKRKLLGFFTAAAKASQAAIAAGAAVPGGVLAGAGTGFVAFANPAK